MSGTGTRPLFLIGFMCCGKTTLGRALATELRVPFTDLDDEVCRRAGAADVNEIFATRGEAGFRALETQTLRDIVGRPGGSSADAPAKPRAIIACGGGTPCQPGNMELMLGGGTVVWLDAGIDCLVRRLAVYGDSRPLVRGLGADELRRYVCDTLARRRAFYGRAHVRFDSSELEDAAQVEASVRRFIASVIS